MGIPLTGCDVNLPCDGGSSLTAEIDDGGSARLTTREDTVQQWASVDMIYFARVMNAF